MGLTQRSIILGSHLFAFMEGKTFTIPGAGTASRTSKPGAADTGWVDLGVIEEAELSRSSEEIKIFGPFPGRLRLHDKIETKDELMIKFTTKELGPLAFEVLLKTLALTSSSTQF